MTCGESKSVHPGPVANQRRQLVGIGPSVASLVADCLCSREKLGLVFLLQHKAGQEGRGEILLENSFRR